MSEYLKYATCPICACRCAKVELIAFECIGNCDREDRGCGNFWSLETGLRDDTQPTLSEGHSMSRRAFIGGAVATPVVASNALIPAEGIAKTASICEKVKKTTTILNITDSNMAGFYWHWNFDLNGNADGSFTLTGIQIEEYPEDDYEPWELDARQRLRSGDELLSALQGMVGEAGYHADSELLMQVSENLDAADSAVALEFRQALNAFVAEEG